MNYSPEFEEVREVNFLALPSLDQLKRAGMTEAQAGAYRTAQWRIRQAQESCAVVAAEILRPQDVTDAKHELREAMYTARRKYREHCLSVFSEKCTKGL
jgi:hypothetical protein